MPYIGRDAQTAQSQNKVIDDISSSFNGSTTSFALLVGGVAPAPFPATSQNLLISVGGVIQEPDSTGTNGYQLTGANIVFSAAPASGQSFFGVILAGADYVNAGANFPDGDAGTPSITFSQDLDTGLFRSGTGTTSITSNNNRIADFGTTEIVFNEDGDDINFRVEGDAEANLLFVDAGNDRVGINTTSPTDKLTISSGSNQIGLDTGDQTTYGTLDLGHFANGAFIGTFAGSDTASNLLRLGTTGTERMRIASSGHIHIHSTTNFPGVGNTNTGAMFENASGGTTIFVSRGDSLAAYFGKNVDGDLVRFSRSGNAVGGISVTTSSTSYNTSSDYRLKENVVSISDGITRVKQLAPKRFNFIADADTTVDGFLAHEAQTVVPEAVTGTHNEVDDDGNDVMQGIDQSKLVPLLTAGLQEAIAKIETLETKVAALEGA